MRFAGQKILPWRGIEPRFRRRQRRVLATIRPQRRLIASANYGHPDMTHDTLSHSHPPHTPLALCASRPTHPDLHGRDMGSRPVCGPLTRSRVTRRGLRQWQGVALWPQPPGLVLSVLGRCGVRVSGALGVSLRSGCAIGSCDVIVSCVCMQILADDVSLLCGRIVASTRRCRRRNRGSIPRHGRTFCLWCRCYCCLPAGAAMAFYML